MKGNGEMRFTCGNCAGCPAVSLSPEQYKNVLTELKESQKPFDRELAKRFVHMEVFIVFCSHHKSAVLAKYRSKGLL